MRLSEIVQDNIKIIKDGDFDNLAQCTVKTTKNILTFFSEHKYLEDIYNNKNIKCIICKNEDLDLFLEMNLGIIIATDPKLVFFKIHNFLSIKQKKFKSIIDSTAKIAKSSVISKSNVKIGKNVIIEENVVIKENVYIGDNTKIRTGCVIGGEGFEFKRNEGIDIFEVKHFGNVIIENNVELKEFVTVHQALFSWDDTIIGEFTKIDAKSHIGHASKVGKRVLIGAGVKVSGNVLIKDDVYLGPGSIISNRLYLGEKSKVSLGAVVTKSVEQERTVTGNFAIPHDIFIENLKK